MKRSGPILFPIDSDLLESVAVLSERSPITHHLITIARDLEGRLLDRLRDVHGYAGLRPSLGPLLSIVGAEGERLSSLAAQLGSSKQACSQLVAFARAEGYLAPAQPRRGGGAPSVRLSSRGCSLVEDATRVILEIDAGHAAEIGSEPYRAFLEASAALFVALELPVHADPAMRRAAGRSIGVLPMIAVELQERLRRATVEQGYTGLRPSHAWVLPRVGRAGARIRDLARASGISRQAISAACLELERLGYLSRGSDPVDGRGQILRLTARAERAIACSLELNRALETEIESLLGARRFGGLVRGGRALGLALAGTGSSGSDADLQLRQLARDLRARLGSEGVRRLAGMLVANEERQSRGPRRSTRPPR